MFRQHTPVSGTSYRLYRDAEGTVIIPPGYNIRDNDSVYRSQTAVQLDRQSGTARLKDGVVHVPGGTAVLHPYFHTTWLDRNSEKLDLHIAVDLSMRLECAAVLRRSHYLGDSPGVYIYARRNHGIIGVVALSRLPPHMRPADRKAIERDRGGYIEALWLRRVCVVPEEVGTGVGTALVQASLEFAQDRWVPKPAIAELIATDPNHSFLLKAGFSKAPEGRRGRLGFVESDGSRVYKQANKYYYWRDL